MRFTCKCGFSTTVDVWPFRCVCGRSYASAAAKPTKVQREEVREEPAPAEGPGTELKAMLLEIHAKPKIGCGCEKMAQDMNRWGVEGCRNRRATIVATLRANAAKLNLLELAKAAFGGVTASWVGAIKLTDPLGSLADEAIRRADAKAQTSGS